MHIRILRRLRRRKSATLAIGAVCLCAIGFAFYNGMRSIQRSVERRKLANQAADAMRQGEWKAAVGFLSAAQRLAPDDWSIARELQIAQNMERVREIEIRHRSALLRAEEPPPALPYRSAPFAERKPLLEWQDRIARAQRDRADCESELDQLLLMTLGLDPGFLPARERIAKFHLAQWKEEMSWGNLKEARHHADVVERFGTERQHHSILGPAKVAITTSPKAIAHLFKYEERERRWFPLPCNRDGQTREVEIPSPDPVPLDATAAEKSRGRHLSAFPLNKTSYNEVSLPIQLPPGSYLLVLNSPGFVELRVPILLEPNAVEEAHLALLRPEQVPEGSAYVAPGRFVTGGDRAIVESRRGTPVSLKGFFIYTYPVAHREYLLYLNDREWHPASKAVKRLPTYLAPGEEITDDRRIFSLGDMCPEYAPVTRISWDDANDYAAWKTKRCAEKWRFRLPTEEEYEKAIRGVDGRFYPWGSYYVTTFAGSVSSRGGDFSERSRIEEVGQFPTDESVYGVKDCVGAQCWTATPSPGDDGYYLLKGGGMAGDMSSMRCGYRVRNIARARPVGVGFRLAADLPDGEK